MKYDFYFASLGIAEDCRFLDYLKANKLKAKKRNGMFVVHTTCEMAQKIKLNFHF